MQDPKLYYIDLRAEAQLLLSEFPAIVQHVLGEDADSNMRVEIWSPEHESWRGQLASTPILFDRTHTLILVRYPANGHLRGVGRRIVILQRQSFSKWLLDRLDEYVDGDADEVGAPKMSTEAADGSRVAQNHRLPMRTRAPQNALAHRSSQADHRALRDM